ncbi:hypothetical protein HAX54_008536 [Datura stramonium]|uniref:Uncharacterized protein n=1 Tax=Datura stramonium TaxID=4076 RepID=A0ABS8TDE7_DATST|nr:hypothetical protein [Datura stramonium]
MLTFQTQKNFHKEYDNTKSNACLQILKDVKHQFHMYHFTSLSPRYLTVAERESDRIHAVSISMPPTPKRVGFTDNETIDAPDSAATSKDKKTRFYSQPMPTAATTTTASSAGAPASSEHPRNPRISKLKDKRFDSFKTWSGARNSDRLRFLEESILFSEDKTWPFLLRYPISSFGIILGVSSQAISRESSGNFCSRLGLHISMTQTCALADLCCPDGHCYFCLCAETHFLL